MRLIPLGRGAMCGAVGVAVYACAVGLFSVTADARQAQSVTAGVYSGAQATRGQQVYKAECLACHGDTLGGVVGPALSRRFVPRGLGRKVAGGAR